MRSLISYKNHQGRILLKICLGVVYGDLMFRGGMQLLCTCNTFIINYIIMKKRLFILVLILLCGIEGFSQGREFLRNTIIKWGACKNVAMTLSGGDIALTGKN